jgi:hypothetical protein
VVNLIILFIFRKNGENPLKSLFSRFFHFLKTNSPSGEISPPDKTLGSARVFEFSSDY